MILLKKPSLCGCLIWLAALGCAQGNLVPNGDFETYTTCPLMNSNTNNTGNWHAPTSGTSDFFHACNQETIVAISMSVPLNFAGYQAGFNNSQGYAGLYTYCSLTIQREYIQTQLSSPLIAGQLYLLTFYVSPAEFSEMVTDGLGAYVSAAPISSSINICFAVTPQVQSPQGQVLADTLGWKKITGLFTASGGEEYITIGNFNTDATTTTLKRRQNPGPFGFSAYYYVDGVCLSSSPQACYVSLGEEEYTASQHFFYYDSYAQRLVFEEGAAPCTITILNLIGEPLKTMKLTTETTLDVTDLMPGYYLVYADKGQRASVQKVLIH